MIIKNVNITLPGMGYALANGHPLYVQRFIPEPGDMHIYFEDNTTHTLTSTNQAVQFLYDKPFDMDYIVFKQTFNLGRGGLYLSKTAKISDANTFVRCRNRYYGVSFGGVGNGNNTGVINLVAVNGHTLDSFDGWTYFRDPAESTSGVYKVVFDIKNAVAYHYKDNEYYGYGTVRDNVNSITCISYYNEGGKANISYLGVAGFMSFDEAASW